MSAGPAILQGASGILKLGAIQQEARAKQQAGDYNAYINMENAKQAEQQAAEQERLSRVGSDATIGQARANYGASGVSGASGSALDVLAYSARNAEMDALQIRHQGELRAWASRTGAALDIVGGAQARVAGNYAAAGTLLDTLSKTAEKAPKQGA